MKRNSRKDGEDYYRYLLMVARSDASPRILLLEDDPSIGGILKRFLGGEGFTPTLTTTVKEARQAIESETFSLLLLDVNLPDGNGFDFCRDLREAGEQTPVVFLTANSGEEAALKAFALGASDFVRKPFGKAELAARIRRFVGLGVTEIRAGKYALDLKSRFLTEDEKKLRFTPSEFEIMRQLMKHAGEVVPREQIVEALPQEGFDRVIDSHMSHLRSKLKKAGMEGIKIVPVYGVGYRLEIE